MSQTTLNNAPQSIETAYDNIVIVDNFQSIRGGFSLNTIGFADPVIFAGHPIIEETATGQLKPMPGTRALVNGVGTFGTIVPGTGYTNGTYTNVPLYGSQTGSGALATVVVSGNAVTSVTKSFAGEGYQIGDNLTAYNSFMGGAGSGFSVPVATVANVAGAFGTLPTGHTYAGVNISTRLTRKPMAGIMVRGTVNPTAFQAYAYASILTAIKAALPLIDFRADR